MTSGAEPTAATVDGRVTFVQLVAVDAGDVALAEENGSAAVLERLVRGDPLLVTVVGPVRRLVGAWLTWSGV